MSIPYDLLVEGLVVVLLLVTVFYCISLERKLRALRSGKDELKSIIASLNTATENAQSGVYHLKAAGTQTSEQLDGLVSDARQLADELELMIGSGKALADRLEDVRRGGATTGQGQGGHPVHEPDEDLFEEDQVIRALKEAR